MKGLLFRELYPARKYYITSFLIYLIISVMGILIRLSLICGNLADRSDADYIDNVTLPICGYLPFIIIMIMLCTDGGVIFADYRTNWIRFVHSSPLTEKKFIAVKYTLKLILLAVGVTLGFTNAVIVYAISDRTSWSDIFLNTLFIFTITVMISSLIIPICLKCKNKSSSAVPIVAIFTAIYIPTVLALLNYIGTFSDTISGLSEDEADKLIMSRLTEIYEAIRNTADILSPVIIAAALIVSFLLSLKIIKRRDN